ncbi:DNL zinc finger-domain-containing protein [Hyaloraphidium curvatum]|nr:DNL zinc finger-domain-containing protein [Hyaloraphidium curvatum]
MSSVRAFSGLLARAVPRIGRAASWAAGPSPAIAAVRRAPRLPATGRVRPFGTAPPALHHPRDPKAPPEDACGCGHDHSHEGHNHHHAPVAAAEPAEDASPADGRLFIGFTCTVCNTRSYHTMSRQAYNKGVVIIACPGCKNKHLMADHLGWFDSQQKVGTIEEILERAGRGDEIAKGSVGVPLARLQPRTAILEQPGEDGKPVKITIDDAFSFLPKDLKEAEAQRVAKAARVLNHPDTPS